MKFKVKSATINDLKKIQELNLLLFEKEYAEFDETLNCKWTFSKEGTEYFKNRINKNDGCVFVACSENEIVGYLAGGLISNKENYRVIPKSAEIENMFIADKHRRMGIGTKLYQLFVDWCKAKEVKRLRVTASAQNKGGINFYRKNGFTYYDLTLEKEI